MIFIKPDYGSFKPVYSYLSQFYSVLLLFSIFFIFFVLYYHVQNKNYAMMLGDGVNDVPVLAAADISVAMGSASDLAKTSADAVLLSNRLGSLVDGLKLAKRTRRIIIENLAWATLYNGLVLPFAALGWITPIWAAVGMSLSSLLVVLNALRLSRTPNT